jgi:hypothetical protein
MAYSSGELRQGGAVSSSAADAGTAAAGALGG